MIEPEIPTLTAYPRVDGYGLQGMDTGRLDTSQ